MGITVSHKKPKEPQVLEINQDISVAATGAVIMNIPFIIRNMEFFPFSFKLELGGKLLYIDPVGTEEKNNADVILITHDHMDHFSLKDIISLSTTNTTIICPKSVFKKISKKRHKLSTGVKLVLVRPMESQSVGDISITTIPCYNMKKGLITAHPKSAENVGYVIRYGDVRLFHSGDSDVVPEMKTLENITVAMVPIDGDGLTMSTESAVEFVNRLKPQFVIPAHYRLGTDELQKFTASVDESINVKIMDGQEENV